MGGVCVGILGELGGVRPDTIDAFVDNLRMLLPGDLQLTLLLIIGVRYTNGILLLRISRSVIIRLVVLLLLLIECLHLGCLQLYELTVIAA